MNDHLFGKELFIRFTVRAFCKLLSNFVCFLLSLLDLRVRCGGVILLIPDHCLSIYFSVRIPDIGILRPRDTLNLLYFLNLWIGNYQISLGTPSGQDTELIK